MKKLSTIILFYFFFSCQLIFSQTGWFVQQSGITNPLRDVYFVNSLTGWAVGDSGKIVKTINGGTNWFQQISNTTYNLNTVRFYNDQIGWITGGVFVISTPYSFENGIILKTTDGGANWTVSIQTNSGNIFNDLSIIDQNNIYVVYGGDDWSLGYSIGNIFKSTNGGNNWSNILFAPDNSTAFHSVHFINSNTGWASGIYTTDVIPLIHTRIYKTTNQGVNWNYVRIDSGNVFGMGSTEKQKLRFNDANTGYFLQRVLEKSTNGGINWFRIDSLNTVGGKSFYFADKDTGWFVSSTGNIRKTTNGGLNWISQYSPVSGLLGIYFLNYLTGWAVGNNGYIVKTINGGYSPPLDTEYVKYFPLNVGNIYSYYWSEGIIPVTSGYFRAKITKDTIMNSHRYYYLYNFPDIGTGWVRFDSSRSNLLYYSPNANCSGYINDKIIDSLKMSYNNQITSCVYHWSLLKCEDTSNVTIFNNTVPSRAFRHDGLQLAHIKYAKNFGIISFDEGEPPPSTYFVSISGCKINGVVYGDTNVYHTISGYARYSDNSQNLTSGTIKAFKLDKSTGNIIVLDTALIQSNGSYTLSHVPEDSLDIGVFPNSVPPNDYVITYYPSTVYWQSATVLYPTGNLSNINISALRLLNTTANNSVNGKVTRLTDETTGNLKDAFLYAKNGNTFVRCTVSDVNGVYHLQSLPAGNIKILVTRLGFNSDSANVSVTATSNTDSVNFHLYMIYTGIKQISNSVPSDYKLFQNYPNPFNPSTVIRFQIKDSRLVTLKVYDILGKEVAMLVNEKLQAGEYEIPFNISQFSNNRISSGIYFYRLQAGDYVETKKMVLVK